jgi:hypothetical protein
MKLTLSEMAELVWTTATQALLAIQARSDMVSVQSDGEAMLIDR